MSMTTINGVLQPASNHLGTLVGSATTVGTTLETLCEFDVLPERVVMVVCEIVGVKVGAAKSHCQTWVNWYSRASGDAQVDATVNGQTWTDAFDNGGAGIVPAFGLVGGGSPNRARLTVGGNAAETWQWAATINLYTTAGAE